MSSPHQGSGSGLSGAFLSLATIASLIGMFFVAPRLWPLVEAQAWAWLVQLYSYETAWWLLLGCQVAMWLFTFVALRAALAACLATLTMLIAKRMM